MSDSEVDRHNTDATLAAERANEDAEDQAQNAALKKAQDDLSAALAADVQEDAAYELKIKELSDRVKQLEASQPPSTQVKDFGVCIHSTFRTSIYADDAKTLDAAKRSGAKYYRDLLSMTSFKTAQATLFKQYKDAGMKAHLTCGTYKTLPTYNYAQTVTNLKAMDGCVAEVAGVNEPDDSDNGGSVNVWKSVVAAHQTKLYDAVKGDPATKDIPVGLGALRWANGNKWAENKIMVDACAGKFDFFNLHFYPGKGSNVEAELTAAQTEIRKFTDKPIIISEGGGTTANMTLDEQARICKDLVTAGRKLGIKVYVYELLDDVNPAGTDVQSNFGIYESDWSDKAAVKALRSIA